MVPGCLTSRLREVDKPAQDTQLANGKALEASPG